MDKIVYHIRDGNASMVEMVGDANLLETRDVGDLRRAVHADADPTILPLEEWDGT